MNIGEKYNKVYAQKERVFGTEPVSIVKELIKYVSSGMALDLGAGEGRNCLFLAERGFVVKAIDSSSVGIEKLKKFAAGKGVNINAMVGDIRTFEVSKKQDVIIAACVLHFFSPSEALSLIERMKS